MYAVIESGGKQYRVELGNEIEVDRLDVEAGQTIRIERVLLVADGDDATIGRPLVDGALVNADVLRQDRGEKLIVFKYKPKARTRVKKGHRADLTVLRIAEIALNGKSAAKEAAAAAAEQKAARDAADKAAAEKAAADKALAAKLAPKPEAKGGKAATRASGAKAGPKATRTPEVKAKAADKPAAKPAAAKGATSRTQAGEDKTKAAAGKTTVTKTTVNKTTVSKGAAKGTAASKTSAAKDSGPKSTTKVAGDAPSAGGTKKDE